MILVKIETKNGSNVDCQENVNGEDNRAKRVRNKEESNG